MSGSSGLPCNPSNDMEGGLKDVPVQRITRWRQARLFLPFLKACRRFQYTLVLKRDQVETEQAVRKFRAHAQALRAVCILKQGADQVKGTGDRFPIEPEKLASLTRTNSGVDVLKQYGGKEGLAVTLKTDLAKGINGDDLLERRIKFGSNVHLPRTARRLWTCIWEALHDFTRIVLVISFVGSVVMGILEETKKLGWHDVFSVAIVAALFILVTAISDYTQAHLFQHMIKEKKRNIQLKVTRGGRLEIVSISDIVVGDVYPFRLVMSYDIAISSLTCIIVVPADGIFIGAQSLKIDKSRITGELEIFYKDSTRPFLRSGWRVADGSGTMLVTAVGKFTESGNLMASTNSKDAEKKTPLQVLLKEVATFMGAVGFLVAIVVVYVVWLRDYFTAFTGENLNGSPIPGDTLEEVPIFVVAIPEVLLLYYNLILLSSMKKMKADNALVRVLVCACETIAFCNNVLCDKIAIATNEGACEPGRIMEAVDLCQKAGIKVRMVTHENLQTAKAIAEKYHILGSDSSEDVPDNILVMAESSPQDKLLLVQALRKGGKVVAVTGYATDDAHALHEADIGLAMGIQGTEVVKENSDIIILDDNFATIVECFKWGRSVHEKVLKVMQQQLTANVVAIIINCMAAVYYGHIPLNAVQFVW
ncbi:hypothetical protein M0R45_002725 [Rubus argutus]|uniref:Cation-transporting P-type ATPase N-terminal domain-containing protein n=1 Tax=Rubus argutus TaxID=59490 RepID=A0AAW1VN67_RUBAR